MRNSTRYALAVEAGPIAAPQRVAWQRARVDSTLDRTLGLERVAGHGPGESQHLPGEVFVQYQCLQLHLGLHRLPARPHRMGKATILAYNELYGTSGPNGLVAARGPAARPSPRLTGPTTPPIRRARLLSRRQPRHNPPVLSLAGDQVAFIQVNSSSVASLVLLKWAVSTSVVALDTAATNVTAANYRACTAPCMTRITLNGSPNDTWSAPFYEYYDDLLYVGDNSGKLHKFTNIFLSGTRLKSPAVIQLP